VDVQAVEQRPRQPSAVAVTRGFSAATRQARMSEVPTSTRVYGADQQRARRKARSRAGSGDVHEAVFQWLAERLERRATELGELIQEEHAVMRQADLAGRGTSPPPTSPASLTEWCGARNGRSQTMPRSLGKTPATLWIAVQSMASSKRSGGSSVGKSRASMVLPLPGGPIISKIVAAGCGDFERAPSAGLTAYVCQIERGLRELGLELGASDAW